MAPRTRSMVQSITRAAAAALGAASAIQAPALAQEIRIDPVEERFLLPTRTRPIVVTADELSSGGIEVDAQTLALAARLDSPDYHQREAAAEQLEGETIHLAQLYGLLEGARLNAEQRYRMLEIIRHRLIHAPRGAVGIQMQPRAGAGAQPPGLEVMAVLDGLPAKGVLQPGDRITHIDGRAVLHQLDLITYVQNKRPGEQVELAVQRPLPAPGAAALPLPAQRASESLRINLALGSAEKLNEFNDGAPSNPVLSARRTQAMMLSTSFAPQPRTIDVPRLGPEPPPGGSARRRSGTIDEHPVIQSLLNHREMLEADPDLDTPQLRAMWQMTLEWMLDEAENPLLSEFEREQLLALAERYAELLPAAEEADAADAPGALEVQPR